jgi:hypothetical protein
MRYEAGMRRNPAAHGRRARRSAAARNPIALAVLFLVSCSSSTEEPPAPAPGGHAIDCPGAGAPGGVTIEALKICLGKGVAAAQCMEPLFREHLKSHSTAEALTLLRCYEEVDDTIKEGCHPVAHAIGRETFGVKRTVDASFAACDGTCMSGCYHGAMERFLRGESSTDEDHISLHELQDRVSKACDPNLVMRLRFQCLHGLGHAVMYYSGYSLRPSLAICDSSGADVWTRQSCYGGVFMENIVAADPKIRDVSPTDYHYPCNAVEEQYKGECYVMQTSRMGEMGLTPAQIFDECRKAGDYRYHCIQSLGRDLSNQARLGHERAVSSTCELGQGEELLSCTRGVVFPLIDATEDARYAFPYCATYTSADSVKFCYETSAKYLSELFGKTGAELADQCARYSPGNTACTDAAKR